MGSSAVTPPSATCLRPQPEVVFTLSQHTRDRGGAGYPCRVPCRVPCQEPCRHRAARACRHRQSGSNLGTPKRDRCPVLRPRASGTDPAKPLSRRGSVGLHERIEADVGPDSTGETATRAALLAHSVEALAGRGVKDVRAGPDARRLGQDCGVRCREMAGLTVEAHSLAMEVPVLNPGRREIDRVQPGECGACAWCVHQRARQMWRVPLRAFLLERGPLSEHVLPLGFLASATSEPDLFRVIVLEQRAGERGHRHTFSLREHDELHRPQAGTDVGRAPAATRAIYVLRLACHASLIVHGMQVPFNSAGLPATLEEVAAAAGCSLATVQRAIRRGRLSATHVLGRVVVDRESLARFVESRLRVGASSAK
jgi:hypothetical protein